MFPLNTDTFPNTSIELANVLNASLRQHLQLPGDPVKIEEIAYPHLASIEVSLNGADLSERPPALPEMHGEAVPALTVDRFKASGERMAVGPAAIDFFLEAEEVDLRRALDAKGNVLLLLHTARRGRIETSIATADLEALIAKVAASEARKHGVAVDNVQLFLRSSGPRALAAEVRLRGKKLFMSASLRITGQLDLDEQLNARISGLDCVGEGAIASVACGILKPQLETLEGRVFPLMSLPIGDIRLRDVRIAVGDRLSVNAEFGST